MNSGPLLRGPRSRPGGSHCSGRKSSLQQTRGAIMLQYYEDKLEGSAYAYPKEDLGMCLLLSDCGVQEGKSPRQCLKEGYCKALKYSFFECKRSMLDTRVRFRGRQDIYTLC
nr:cytochrome c oxidase assembly factor 5-like [Saimiri boliviensis boliviensis]